MKTNIAVFIIIAALTYFATLYYETRTPAQRQITQAPVSVSEGVQTRPAPDFTFTDQNGLEQSLSDFKDRPVILNFWASWCPPCIKELPLLLKAAEESGATLIALSSDIDEKSMNAFLEKQNLSSPPENVYFAWDENQSVTQKQFQTFKLPETILIDGQQNMRSKLIGADWEYEELLQQLGTL